MTQLLDDTSILFPFMSAQSSSSLPLNMLNIDLLTLKIPDANNMDIQHSNEEATSWQEVQAAEDYFVDQL